MPWTRTEPSAIFIWHFATFQITSICVNSWHLKGTPPDSIKEEFRDLVKERRKSLIWNYCSHFSRLVFGLKPSPAILEATVEHHLLQHSMSEPENTKILEDTLMTGTDSEDKEITANQQRMWWRQVGWILVSGKVTLLVHDILLQSANIKVSNWWRTTNDNQWGVEQRIVASRILRR